jgi:hypothetical protein
MSKKISGVEIMSKFQEGNNPAVESALLEPLNDEECANLYEHLTNAMGVDVGALEALLRESLPPLGPAIEEYKAENPKPPVRMPDEQNRVGYFLGCLTRGNYGNASAFLSALAKTKPDYDRFAYVLSTNDGVASLINVAEKLADTIETGREESARRKQAAYERESARYAAHDPAEFQRKHEAQFRATINSIADVLQPRLEAAITNAIQAALAANNAATAAKDK